MRTAIIADEQLIKLYPMPEGELFTVPPGEQSKTREMKQHLEDQLLSKGFGRDSRFIAFGGGVICDLTGFLAATYCRGAALHLIPTTLLAMVDASIGGKTAVNTPFGKNMIGAFYPPHKVTVDPSYLKTLPDKELFCGWVEMIKHALITSEEELKFLEKHFMTLPSLEMIERSRKIKQIIVEKDLHEKGVRAYLNLGHTFGHALELLSNYTLSHGEAVAWGLIAECAPHISDRLFTLFERWLPPIEWEADEIWHAMQSDKKNRDGQVKCILLDKLGKPYLQPITQEKYEAQFVQAVPAQKKKARIKGWPG